MRKHRFLAAALCAALLFCNLIPAYAAPDLEDEEPTSGAETTGGYDPANPLTPKGTGKVTDNATDEEGKEFFTITTEDGAVFYLVIDRQRNGENVYFLNAVTLDDLTALAESSGKTITPIPTPAPSTIPEPVPTPIPTETATTEPDPSAQPGMAPNLGMLLGAVAVVILGGGAGWYFKIYRPKHQKPAEMEDYSDDIPEDYGEGMNWDGDGEE